MNRSGPATSGLTNDAYFSGCARRARRSSDLLNRQSLALLVKIDAFQLLVGNAGRVFEHDVVQARKKFAVVDGSSYTLIAVRKTRQTMSRVTFVFRRLFPAINATDDPLVKVNIAIFN
jgi:hypothetical protein